MQSSSTRSKIARHVVALVSSALTLTVVPVLLYIGLIVWSGDIGGPLNIVIVPVISLALGLAASVCLFLPCGLLHERFAISSWVFAVVLILCVVIFLLLPSVWFYGFHAPAKTSLQVLFTASGVVSLYLLLGLTVYFLCLRFSQRLFT